MELSSETKTFTNASIFTRVLVNGNSYNFEIPYKIQYNKCIRDDGTYQEFVNLQTVDCNSTFFSEETIEANRKYAEARNKKEEEAVECTYGKCKCPKHTGSKRNR